MQVDMSMDTGRKLSSFQTCHRKQSKIPRLGITHSNICGPMEIIFCRGGKNFAALIDDKPDVANSNIKETQRYISSVQKYKARVKKQTGNQILCLWSDNAKEYFKYFMNFLENEVQERQLSLENIPQRNGVAEQNAGRIGKIRRISCIQLQGKLP